MSINSQQIIYFLLLFRVSRILSSISYCGWTVNTSTKVRLPFHYINVTLCGGRIFSLIKIWLTHTMSAEWHCVLMQLIYFQVWDHCGQWTVPIPACVLKDILPSITPVFFSMSICFYWAIPISNSTCYNTPYFKNNPHADKSFHMQPYFSAPFYSKNTSNELCISF